MSEQNPRFSAVALALAAMLLSAPALADTQASATISGLTFSLIDLDPNDGVSPSLTWASPLTSVQADHSFGQIVTLQPQPDGSLQWSVSFAQTVGDARQGEASFAEPLSASAAGASATTGATAFSASASVTSPGSLLVSFAYGTGTFLLSANTELRVSGVLSATASGPASAGFQNPAGVAPDFGVMYSQASAYAEVFLGAGSTVAMAGGASYTPNTNPALFPTDAFVDASSAQLSASFRNESALSSSGMFYVVATAMASEIAPLPVPEPGAAALLALGLCALALRGIKVQRGSVV